MELLAIFIILILFLAASLLLVLGAKSETKTNIWFGLFIFCAGVLGYLATLVQHYVIPRVDPTTGSTLLLIKNIVSTISYRFSPYFFLNASISFTNRPMKIWHKRLGYILLIPILFLYVGDVVLLKDHLLRVYQQTTNVHLIPTFYITCFYGFLYMVLGYILYCQAYIIEKRGAAKNQKLLACILNLPPLIITFNTYIPKGADYIVWKASFWLVFIFATLFVILITKFSMLGYKIIIAQQQLDGSMRAATSGALILNHAVKNELAKINLGMETLKNTVQSPELQEVIRIISNSTNHLSEMVNRIKNQMQDIILFPERIRLVEIIEPALESIEKPLHDKHIHVSLDYDPQFVLSGDKVHLQEVMVNILHNAVEAMGQEGTLKVSGYLQRRYLKIIVHDNGTGISKDNLARVFEPFFSTKKFGQNYGLGLSYCYNVMRKHRGKLEIESTEKVGTSVILSLPYK